MENLIEFIESTLAAAHGSCTPCLIKYLGEDKSQLAGIVRRLKVAHEWLSAPDGEEEFTAALVEFLTHVIEMAVFTAELMHRPGVRWTDESTEIAIPVITIISPN